MSHENNYPKKSRKQFNKLQDGEKRKFKKHRDLFFENPHHPALHNHKLKGKWSGYRSINITGDIRAIYKPVDETMVHFVAVGTHSELYG